MIGSPAISVSDFGKVDAESARNRAPLPPQINTS
jgi:hypothetical protein